MKGKDGTTVSRRALIEMATIGTAALGLAAPAAAKAPRKLVKVITAVRRKDGVSREDFLHAWTVVHAGMAKGVPGVIRFVANPVTAEPGRSDVPELMESGKVDGLAETWIDAEAIATLGNTPEAKAWYAHGATIFGSAHNFVVEEIVVLDR